MSPTHHHPPARRGARRLLAGGLAAALGVGVLGASAFAASALADEPVYEPGVAVRTFEVSYNLQELCTIKPGQTPNVETVKPTVDMRTVADFGAQAFPDKFISHTLGRIQVDAAGTYQFELRSDDGSKLHIDDELVIDHDGLHGADPKTGSVALTAGYHELFIEHFEAGGGEQVTLSWKKPGDATFTIVPTSVLSTETGFARVTSPGTKECEGVQDTPGDGLQLAGLNPAYDLVDLRPAGFEPKVTGLAWEGDDLLVLTWGGTGDPVNQTSEGKLYRLAGARTADGPEDVTLTELWGGMREPQGVAVVDVDADGKNEYYVSEKDQISRLENTDADPQLETEEMLWKVPTSGNFHEFAFGLLYKDGKFHLNTSVSIDYGGATTNPQQAPTVDGKQIRGNHVTVDAKTGEMEIVAGGLRTPNGIGFGPEGGTFVTDNQGGWLPASKLVHVKQGRFFEHRTTPAGPFQDEPATKPVLWMPQNEIANSPSTPVMVPNGPFEGQLMIGDVTYGGLQRAFLEKVDGEYQGALFRGTQGLEAGINEVLMDDDGTIIVGGIGGGGNWQQNGKLQYGLQKLVPSGVTPFEMKSMEVVDGGFKITYTEPVGAETLAELASKYHLEQWRYRATAAYGGPKLDEETLDVTSATASEDGRTVTLAVDGLRPDRVVHLRSPRPFASADGDSLFSTEAWYTLNSYPGYVAPEAPQGVYEQEDQQLLGNASVQTEHDGYSGSGYVGGFDQVGAGVRSAVTVEAAGSYDMDLRYANGPHPFQGPKTVTLVVNGESQVITLPSTGTWQTYGSYRHTVELNAGANTVEILYNAGNDGNVNLDRLTVFPQEGMRYEAEDGVLADGAVVQTEHPGYSGTGFVGGFYNRGANVTLTLNATTAGDHPVTLGYANGPNPEPNQTKKLTVEVNGVAQQISLPPTGEWRNWGTWTGTLPLQVGANTVVLRYGETDDGNVNLDYLDVKAPEAVECEPNTSPNDTFEGDALDTCRWTNIINEDADGYRVADGKLQIDAQAGDLSGGQTDAKNVILQPVTGEDTSTWQAETTVSLQGESDYVQAGLTVWGSNTNYGKVMVMHHPQNGWVTELAKVTNGGLSYSNGVIADGDQQDIKLRMWSDGELLQGAFSVDDGATWTTIGDGFPASGLANPLVGVAAYNGEGSEVASFDDFTLTEPPVVEPPVETCTPVEPEPGYTSLFDGTRASMEDWEMADGGRFVRQDDCSIKSVGAFGLFWHTDPIDYAYSLKMDWMMPGDDNSGVFVGFPDPRGSSWNPVNEGHEIQIDPSDDADSTTGAVYNFQAADAVARDAALNPAGEWNAYEIKVEGDRIRVYLNDTLINDYTDTDPNRMNLPSHIGLQTHGDGDDVFFRNIRINNLDEPDTVASTTTATAQPATVEVGGTTDIEVTVTAEGTTPNGEVTVRDGDQVVGTGTLSEGRATIEAGPLTTAGTRSLVVAYAGDGAVTGSETTVQVLVKDKAAPQAKPVLTVRPPVVDANKARRFGSVKVTCKPTGTRCVGTVKLTSGGKVLGVGKVSLDSGETGKLKIKLTKRARTLLAKRPVVKSTLVVSLDGAGRSTKKVRLKR